MSRTLQQERARAALAQVEGHLAELNSRNDAAKRRREYRSRARELPFMVRANGLGQAVAFFLSKAGGEGAAGLVYRKHLQGLEGWLTGTGRPLAEGEDEERLIHRITSASLDGYLAAQAEAIAYLGWVQKLTTAFVAPGEEESAVDGDGTGAGADAPSGAGDEAGNAESRR